MDIRELENVLRLAIQQNPTHPALAVLAANGQSSANLSNEFLTAMQTLLGRDSNPDVKSILQNIAERWS